MKCKYIKKGYREGNNYILYYLHFQGEEAIRQIEVYENSIVMLTKENPIEGEAFLYDQNFSDINWTQEDFISEKEFNIIWNYYSKLNDD